MQSRYIRNLRALAHREVKIVNVKMDQVKVGRLFEHLFKQENVMRQRGAALGIKAQSPRTCRYKTGIGYGISAGEQRDVVAQAHQLLRKPRDYALRSPVKQGRDAFKKWRYLGNSHTCCAVSKFAGRLHHRM